MTQFPEPSKKEHTDHNDTSASRLFMASNKLSTDINFTDIKNSCKFPTLEKNSKTHCFKFGVKALKSFRNQASNLDL